MLIYSVAFVTTISQSPSGGNEVSELYFLINAVSLMRIGLQWERPPGCFFARPERLGDLAMDLGYVGVQALPIRGLQGDEDGIRLYEDAWNATTSLWQALRHRPGAAGLPSCLNDWVVSPTPKECQVICEVMEGRRIPRVIHHFDREPRHIVEVHPGLNMTPEQIATQCAETGQCLCLDTLHLSRGWLTADPSRADRLSPLWAPDNLKVLAPFTQVIHFHPDDTGNLYPHVGIAKQILCHAPDVRYMVAEYPPPRSALLSPTKSLGLATEMLGVMKEIWRKY